MTTEPVKNELGLVIGLIEDTGETIIYYSYKHGTVGTFNRSNKQYYRVKTYPGGPTTPWNGQDWGITDLLYWDRAGR